MREREARLEYKGDTASQREKEREREGNLHDGPGERLAEENRVGRDSRVGFVRAQSEKLIVNKYIFDAARLQHTSRQTYGDSRRYPLLILIRFVSITDRNIYTHTHTRTHTRMNTMNYERHYKL